MKIAHSKTWNMARKLTKLKIRNSYVRTWYVVRNTEKRGKCEMYTVGQGAWRENLQMRKMKNSHGMTLHMARNTENRAK